MSEQELKACPFCGAAGRHIETPDDHDSVACSDQECAFYWFEFVGEHWNTRPLESALRATIATLKEERDRAYGMADAAAEREKWPGKCACMLDAPNDVCLTHSPAIEKLTAERDALRKRCEELVDVVWRHSAFGGCAMLQWLSAKETDEAAARQLVHDAERGT